MKRRKGLIFQTTVVDGVYEKYQENKNDAKKGTINDYFRRIDGLHQRLRKRHGTKYPEYVYDLDWLKNTKMILKEICKVKDDHSYGTLSSELAVVTAIGCI